MEACLRGRKERTANALGAKSPSKVRILPPPPEVFSIRRPEGPTLRSPQCKVEFFITMSFRRNLMIFCKITI